MTKSIQPELFDSVQPAKKEIEPENLLYFPDDLLEAFGTHYAKQTLKVGYYPMVRMFLLKDRDFCHSQRITFRTYDLLNKKNLSKDELIRVAAVPFLTKELFLAFRETMAADVRVVFDEMVWKGRFGRKTITKRIQNKRC